MNQVNNLQKSWQYTIYPQFHGWKIDEYKKLMSIPVEVIEQRMEENRQKRLLGAFEGEEEILASLPIEFDWRNKNGACIGEVRDQQHCGSCWAFSGTSTLSDRLCIASGGSNSPVLSPQELVDCDTSGAHGCHGAMLTSAWD